MIVNFGWPWSLWMGFQLKLPDMWQVLPESGEVTASKPLTHWSQIAFYAERLKHWRCSHSFWGLSTYLWLPNPYPIPCPSCCTHKPHVPLLAKLGNWEGNDVGFTANKDSLWCLSLDACNDIPTYSTSLLKPMPYTFNKCQSAHYKLHTHTLQHAITNFSSIDLSLTDVTGLVEHEQRSYLSITYIAACHLGTPSNL